MSKTDLVAANKREFTKLCQAVGLGFVVMGAIGYFIRIIHIPVNQILVS
jgi:protein transport protein SEC61 subunit gamma-like protein